MASSVSIAVISGIADARYLKLKAGSEAISALTRCRKVGVGVGSFVCEVKEEDVGWVSEDGEVSLCIE